MEMSSLLWIVLILFHDVIHYTLALECESFRGPVTASTAGATRFIECPQDTYPTMVSCGFEARQYTDQPEEDFGGSWIDDSAVGQPAKCYARNPNNGGGIYPHARCCKFNQDVVCTREFGTPQLNDGQPSTEICHTDSYMLGCSGRTLNNDDENFDGVYPGTNDPSAYGTTDYATALPMNRECNARSNGYEVEAQANCCTASVGLECNVIYQYPGSPLNRLTCPAGQTLINCMGYNIYGNANAMFISGSLGGPDTDYEDARYDNTHGQCITRSNERAVAGTNSEGVENKDVYTSAICCSELTSEPTMDPTSVPSNDPTADPTDNPTFTYAPTEDPTETTDMPSSAPTDEPTMPTNEPTTEPTNEPTRVPTDPTSEPTMEPTGDPSPAPSLPSVAPTLSTDSPSKTPTEPPTVNATPGGLNEAADDGNNEELYLILFIIFGILFCCLLLGLLYYCWRKNKKQEDQVNYNNANVIVVGDGDDDVAAAMQAEGAAGTTAGTSPGTATTYNTTNGTATTGTGTGVDASDGIAGGNPNVQLTPRGPGSTQTTTGNNTSIGTIQSYASTQITNNYSGVDGMSDEDDQKSDVYRVQM